MPSPFELPPLGAAESTTVDFKTRSNFKTEEDRIELAKDVAALANALGGTLVSGAAHSQSTGMLAIYTPYKSAEEAQSVIDAYDKAVRDFCASAPVVAIESPRFVDAPLAREPGWVVVVRVTAYPGQPVGVKAGKDAYRFPVRVGTNTLFYRPDQLAMLMSPEVRRMAILLDAIPSGATCALRQFLATGGCHGLDGVTMLAVEELTNRVRFKLPPPSDGERSIPLDHVQTVYFDAAKHVWRVVVRCFE